MGKSTCANMFRSLRVPVHDADLAVHAAMSPTGPAFGPIAEAFPRAIVDGHIDRSRLGGQVFADQKQLLQLEAILHPLAASSARAFVQTNAFARAPIVVLDIPLLYEAGGDRRTDAVMVITAPAFLQRQRALSRPAMTAQKFDQIRSRQLPDQEKRRRADFVVTSGLGRAHTFGAITQIVTVLSRAQGTVWRPGYGANS